MMWLAGAVFAVGLLGLVWAIRGRRVDDHPLCRRCGFDLIGLYPHADTCPECGAGVREGQGRAIRMGHRRVHRRAMAMALIVMLVSGSGGGLVALGRARGIDWNDYKPAWWLRLEIAHGSRDMVVAAIGEFMDRRSAKKLSATEVSDLVDALLKGLEKGAQRPPIFAAPLEELYYAGTPQVQERIVEWVLAAQVNPKIEWSSDLGRLIVEEGAANRIPTQAFELFLKRAYTPRLELGVQRKLRPGERVPVYAVLDDRGGSGYGLVHGRLGGVETKTGIGAGRPSDGAALMGWVAAPDKAGKYAIEGEVTARLAKESERAARRRSYGRGTPDMNTAVLQSWPVRLEYEVEESATPDRARDIAGRMFFVKSARLAGNGQHTLNLCVAAPSEAFLVKFTVGWKYEGKETHAGMGSAQVSPNSFSTRYSTSSGSGSASSFGSTRSFFPFRLDVRVKDEREGAVVLHIEELVVDGEDLGAFDFEIPGVRVGW